MNRAGREPAEDVVRRISHACESAGLIIKYRHNRWLKNLQMRMVLVGASREDSKHELAMMEIICQIAPSGNVGRCQIFCSATDADPYMSVYIAPHVHQAYAEIDELPNTIRVLMRERDEVISRMNSGLKPPFNDLHWKWLLMKGLAPSPQQDQSE